MSSKYASGKFWTDTLDRTVASFAQALVTTATLESAGVLGVDWQGVLSLSGGYALASLLTSIAFRGNSEPAPTTPAVVESAPLGRVKPYWDPVRPAHLADDTES